MRIAGAPPPAIGLPPASELIRQLSDCLDDYTIFRNFSDMERSRVIEIIESIEKSSPLSDVTFK